MGPPLVRFVWKTFNIMFRLHPPSSKHTGVVDVVKWLNAMLIYHLAFVGMQGLHIRVSWGTPLQIKVGGSVVNQFLFYVLL